MGIPAALFKLALVAALGACVPPYKAEAQPVESQAAPAATAANAERQQSHRYVGVWALVDNANNLFNVRLRPDGRATSTAGIQGTPLAGSGALCSWGSCVSRAAGGPGAMACASTTPTAGLMRC